MATDGKGSFFCLHQPLGSETLRLSIYSCEDGTWNHDEKLPETVKAVRAPAAAWHPRRGLMVVYVDKDFKLQWTIRSAGAGGAANWTEPKPIHGTDDARGLGSDIGATSPSTPGLTLLNDSAVCVYTSAESDEKNFNKLHWAEMFFNGDSPSQWVIQELGEQEYSQTGVSLTSDGHSNILCASAVDDKMILRSKKPGDQSWQKLTVPDVAVSTTPAVAYVTSDSSDPSCVCVYRKHNSNELGLIVSNKDQIPNLVFGDPKNGSPQHHTTTEPAVVYSTYRMAAGGYVNQAMCIHHGHTG